jgi:hypothetical protein
MEVVFIAIYGILTRRCAGCAWQIGIVMNLELGLLLSHHGKITGKRLAWVPSFHHHHSAHLCSHCPRWVDYFAILCLGFSLGFGVMLSYWLFCGSQEAAMGLVLRAAGTGTGWTTGSGLEGPSCSIEGASDMSTGILQQSPRRRMRVAFTCNLCGHRTTRAINPHAYTDGTVFVQVRCLF